RVGTDYVVRGWEVLTPRIAAETEINHDRPLTAAVVNAGQSRLVFLEAKGRFGAWDTPPREPPAHRPGPRAKVKVRPVPDLVCNPRDYGPVFWDVGQDVGVLRHVYPTAVDGFNSTGQFLLQASAGPRTGLRNRIVVVDAATGRRLFPQLSVLMVSRSRGQVV